MGGGAPDWVSRAYGEGHHGWVSRAVSGLLLRCLLSVLTTWAYRSAHLLMAPQKISVRSLQPFSEIGTGPLTAH